MKKIIASALAAVALASVTVGASAEVVSSDAGNRAGICVYPCVGGGR